MSLTQQLTPGGRPDGRRGRGAVIVVGIVALVAVTVTVTLAVSHGGSKGNQGGPATPTAVFGIPSPQPSTSASSTASGILLLPPPTRTAANGVPLGFPHTTEGAASAIVRWDSFLAPIDEARESDVFHTISTQHFIDTALPSILSDYQKHPLPAGIWATYTAVGLKVLSTAPDRVVVATVDAIATGVASESDYRTNFGYGAASLVWSGGDWRLDSPEDTPPNLGAPSATDPAALRAAGWEEFQLG